MAIAKKRKKFFDVEMPIIKKETQLQAIDIEELEGKLIRYDLTRLLRGKSILLQLKVQIKDEKAIATPSEMKLLPYYLRRMMRKGITYVEDSFSTDCNDAKIILKPFLITRRKISNEVRKALRKASREELINYVKTKKVEDLFDDILKNKLQKELSLKLKKIYPLSLCEIRTLKVVKELEPIKEEKISKKKE